MQRSIRTMLAVLLLMAVIGSSSAKPKAKKPKAPVAGQFQYYKFTISSEGEWCFAQNSASQDCTQKREYIVHGLWPEPVHGKVENCNFAAPSPAFSALDPDVEKTATQLMSAFLVDHEWKTHGVCSGLSRNEYFQQIATLHSTVKVPHLDAGQYSTVLQKLKQKLSLKTAA